MKLSKKHVVLSCLILALGAAVYINWTFSDVPPMSVSKELGKAYYVNGTGTATEDTAVPTTVNSVLTQKQQEYFAKVRIDRNQTQDRVLDIAKEILNETKSSESTKKEAVLQAAKVSEYFSQQDNVEGILRAKGFTECVCFLAENGCTIVLLEKELQESSSLVVKDVVKSQTSIEFEKISIVGI